MGDKTEWHKELKGNNGTGRVKWVSNERAGQGRKWRLHKTKDISKVLYGKMYYCRIFLKYTNTYT